MLGYLCAMRRLSLLYADTSVPDVTLRLCKERAVPERDSLTMASRTGTAVPGFHVPCLRHWSVGEDLVIGSLNSLWQFIDDLRQFAQGYSASFRRVQSIEEPDSSNFGLNVEFANGSIPEQIANGL